jgi:galactokinase
LKTTLRLGDLQDTPAIESRLASLGVNADSALGRARQFALAALSLQSQDVPDSEPVVAFFVPGRIEVLGKHTDYAGGHSVVCSVDRGFCIVAAAATNRTVTIQDIVSGEQVAFEFSPELQATKGHWSNYPMTVARRVARNFGEPLRGATITFSSDLPRASGLSSSSALIVGCFSVLSAINDLPYRSLYRQEITDKLALAEYLGTTENGQSYRTFIGDRGVGTFGGSEDHTAILCSEPGVLKCFSYAPTRFERQVKLPEGYVFVIGSSGVRAEKTGGAQQWYNDTATLASEAAAFWRQATGRSDANLAQAIASPGFTFERMLNALRRHENTEWAARLATRFQHFHQEDQEIIPTALDALAAEDVSGFAEAVRRSQEGAERLLGNQIDETTALVRMAHDCGAAAASAFGAGFGGSVWALTQENHAKVLCNEWSERYLRDFPHRRGESQFFVSGSSPATMQL